MIASIELYNFQRMDEDRSSDNTMAELHIETPGKEHPARLAFDFSIGTPEYELIIKILSLSERDGVNFWNACVKSELDILNYLNSL